MASNRRINRISSKIMRFKEICDENVPNHLELAQKVASTLNLILIDANQQLKTFEKQKRNIFNKLPTNI